MTATEQVVFATLTALLTVIGLIAGVMWQTKQSRIQDREHARIAAEALEQRIEQARVRADTAGYDRARMEFAPELARLQQAKVELEVRTAAALADCQRDRDEAQRRATEFERRYLDIRDRDHGHG